MKHHLGILLLSYVLAPGDDQILVLNKSGNSLMFVNPVSGQVETTVAVGNQPHELAVAPNGGKLYVSNVGENTVSVIDMKTRQHLRKISSPDFEFPHGIAFTPDSRTAIITSERKRKILLVDTATDQVVRAVDTDQGGTHMAVMTASGRLVYVTNRESNTVSAYDLKSSKWERHIPVGKGGEGLALSPDEKELWVGNRGEDTVTVVDLEKGIPAATLKSGRGPIRVAFTPDGRSVFVSNGTSRDITVYDRSSRTVTKTIPVGGSPAGLAASPDGRQMFVSCGGENAVYVIDVKTLSVSGKLPAGAGPDGIGYWKVSK